MLKFGPVKDRKKKLKNYLNDMLHKEPKEEGKKYDLK